MRYLDDFLYIGAGYAAHDASPCDHARSVRFGRESSQDSRSDTGHYLSWRWPGLARVLLVRYSGPRARSQAVMRSYRIAALGYVARLAAIGWQDVFCATVLPGARPVLRRLIDALNNVSRHSHHIHMTGPMKTDLFFFQKYIDSWNGRQRWHARPDDVVISTDASRWSSGG